MSTYRPTEQSVSHSPQSGSQSQRSASKPHTRRADPSEALTSPTSSGSRREKGIAVDLDKKNGEEELRRKTAVEEALDAPPEKRPRKSTVVRTQNHLTILQQGVQAWNQWRQEHPDTRPELVGAQLSGMNLHGAQLSAANLSKANLSAANLSMADLSNTDLSGADLRRANLTGANLQGANLSNAFLTNARLVDTVLTNTQFRASDLRGVLFDNTSFTGTVLDGAYLYRTVFGDVDLSAAQGLEQVRHWGPSMLGMEAIARSKGSLPVAFLRGVGVPDPLLPHIHSLVSTVTCFISYAHEDLAFVKSLEADLQQSGVRCWLDPEHKKKGEICSRADDKLLIVLSTHSHTSAWLQSEVEFILQRQAQLGKRLLFLLRLDNAAMLTSGSWEYYTIDFTPWQDPRTYHEVLSQLLRELKA